MGASYGVGQFRASGIPAPTGGAKVASGRPSAPQQAGSKPAPSSRARLRIRGGPGQGAFADLTEVTVVGNHAGHATLVVPDPQLAPRHLEISRLADGFYARDLGTFHGTVIRGHRLGPHPFKLQQRRRPFARAERRAPLRGIRMIESREALAAKAEAEVMACIGCNDCMLACPLPHAKLVTIAELNAAVQLPVVIEPARRRVRDRVHAVPAVRPGVPGGSQPRRHGPLQQDEGRGPRPELHA